jgi:hypothetical protein
MQVLQADKVTLYDLKTKFKLTQVASATFFPEWQEKLPEITALEKQDLERVKESYFNLTMRPMLEDIVKMVVLSPLLDWAGFYLAPFYTTSEQSVEITNEDNGIVIRGKIDVLIVQDRLWILVIESKRSEFSLEVGIPQALSYMLANPQPERPVFGLVTNGSNFIFIKLLQKDCPIYALSDEFTLRRGNDLYTVLSILKKLSRAILDL